ncbi:MAG: ABC transporter permease, partial [bacterium]
MRAVNYGALLRSASIALLRNKMRSALTVLGITIGIGAVICVVAIGNAGQTQVEQQLNNLGDNFVWIEAGGRAVNGVRTGTHGTKSLTLADAAAIKTQVPLIKSVSPNVDGQIQVIYGNQNWSTSIQGAEVDWPLIRSWNVAQGQFFTDQDNKNAGKVAVLGQTVATNLFGSEDPVGKMI